MNSIGQCLCLLVPRVKNHLSSFELGFLNIFSRQNLLHSLALVLFLLQRYKYGAKKCPKNQVRFDFWDDSTLANQKTGKIIEKPLKELPWNQQYSQTEARNLIGCFFITGLKHNKRRSYTQHDPTKQYKPFQNRFSRDSLSIRNKTGMKTTYPLK